MARRSRKQKKPESAGAPPWMTTFSDLMTLLLTFFVLLFSMSSVNEEQFREIAFALQMALLGSNHASLLDGEGDTLSDLNLEDLDIGEVEDSGAFEDIDPEELEVVDEAEASERLIPEEVHELYGVVMNYMEEEGIESDVTISRDQEGVYIDIKEAILFSPGSSEITDYGQNTLSSLSGMFELFDNRIIIEGYTDDVPMNTAQFPSNWELSAGRAMSVLRYLSESREVDPNRLSASAYGEHHPIVPNDSSESRAQNRRVNLVIVHNEREVFENGTEFNGSEDE